MGSIRLSHTIAAATVAGATALAIIGPLSLYALRGAMYLPPRPAECLIVELEPAALEVGPFAKVARHAARPPMIARCMIDGRYFEPTTEGL